MLFWVSVAIEMASSRGNEEIENPHITRPKTLNSFVSGANAHDMPAVELHHRFVVALIGIVNDRDGLLPYDIASAVDPGDQDEPARDALPLHGHLVSRCCAARPI